MIDALRVLQKEHRQIMQSILELEAIIQDDVLNYAHLIHTLKNLQRIMEDHEDKENQMYLLLSQKIRSISGKSFSEEHDLLKSHREALFYALRSGSEYRLKQSISIHGLSFIQKTKNHLKEEDDLFETISSIQLPSRVIQRINSILKPFDRSAKKTSL